MASSSYPYSRTITPFYSRQPSWAGWDDTWSEPSMSRFMDQPFGMAPSMMDEFFNQWRNWMRTHSTTTHSSSHNFSHQQTTGSSDVTQDEKEFRVRLDVSHFTPEELTVKTVDNRVMIHAKHEEKPDEHGFIQREFTRQYLLPRECDPSNVTSILASDGILTVRATKSNPVNGNERVIPVTQEAAKV